MSQEINNLQDFCLILSQGESSGLATQNQLRELNEFLPGFQPSTFLTQHLLQEEPSDSSPQGLDTTVYPRLSVG